MRAASLVLLLLIREPVPLPLSRRLLPILALVLGCLGTAPAAAADRTFVLTPADLVAAPDLFGAKALSRSAVLKRAVGLRGGAVRFAKGVCPSLLADPTRKITRVRLLGGPAAAPLVVGRSLGGGLTAALTAMNAATWLPPSAGTTRQAHWVVEPPIAEAVGFTTAGFAAGDQTGALTKADAEQRAPGFRMTVNLESHPGTGAAELAVAVTTELPSKRIGKPGKRTECLMVASLLPVDIEALRDLVNAAPLEPVIGNRLRYWLNTAATFLERGKRDRAARNVRSFALEVAQRSESEVPPAFAEAMINRANTTAEALSF